MENRREDFDAQREAMSNPSPSGNALGDRGRANEEAWAARENARLLEELRKKGAKPCPCATGATTSGDKSQCCQVTDDKAPCQADGSCACKIAPTDSDARNVCPAPTADAKK